MGWRPPAVAEREFLTVAENGEDELVRGVGLPDARVGSEPTRDADAQLGNAPAPRGDVVEFAPFVVGLELAEPAEVGAGVVGDGGERFVERGAVGGGGVGVGWVVG